VCFDESGLAGACSGRRDGSGDGRTNPAAAEILTRLTPAHRRGLFLIKQTGVPLGVGLAGLSLSLLLAFYSWQISSLVLNNPLLGGCAPEPAKPPSA
jgi:hypothetical protein